jgi:uncharacterized protein (DUF2147 family)
MRSTVLCAGLLLSCAVATPSWAADPAGTWLTQDGDAKVRIARCGGGWCGSIVWLREPIDPATRKPPIDDKNPDAGKRGRPIIGVQILIGFLPSGPDRWSGRIYNPDDGNTYEGHLSIADRTHLNMQGCLIGICKAEIWGRTK